MMLARGEVASPTGTVITKPEPSTEGMTPEELMAELTKERARRQQLEETLERLIFEFDRNLGALFTLASMPKAKELVNWPK